MMLVTFSGIDGAGKSTLINRLREGLQEAGIRVLSLAFWEDVAVLRGSRQFASRALFAGEQGVGTPAKPVNRRDKNVQSRSLTALRFVLYLLDAVSLRVVVAKTRAATPEIALFDRYLYDEVANLPLAGRFARAYARFLMRLAPKPALACLVDADPVLARRRKPEYPLHFLRSNRESFQVLGELMGGMKVIPSPTAAEVEAKLLQELLARLQPSPAGGRPRAAPPAKPQS